jgi:hypothetical protein
MEMWSATTSCCSSCVSRTRWRASSSSGFATALAACSRRRASVWRCRWNASASALPHYKRQRRLSKTGLVADTARSVFVGRLRSHESAMFFLIGNRAI